jgi:uncharacterized protein (TIGR00725 family)
MDTQTGQAIKVAVIGSSRGREVSPVDRQEAYRLGALLASKEWVVLTGGGNGSSAETARGCTENGGFCIGVSPAQNMPDHVENFQNPVTVFSTIVFTGFGYKGRNVILMRSCDAVICLGGGVGTLNELTIALDEGKPIIVFNKKNDPAISAFLKFYKDVSKTRKFSGKVTTANTVDEAVKKLSKLLTRP